MLSFVGSYINVGSAKQRIGRDSFLDFLLFPERSPMSWQFAVGGQYTLGGHFLGHTNGATIN